jgi:hypothetical protein
MCCFADKSLVEPNDLINKIVVPLCIIQCSIVSTKPYFFFSRNWDNAPVFISLFNEFKFCRIIPNLNLWTARTNWCPQNIELTKKDIYLMFWPIISCNSWSFYICFVPILVQPMYCYVLFMSAYSRINFRWVIFHELNNWIASIVPINATCRLPALYRNQSMGVQFYIKL